VTLRPILSAAIGVPFLLGTIALVQWEGRLYRAALREARSSAAEGPLTNSPVETAPRTSEASPAASSPVKRPLPAPESVASVETPPEKPASPATDDGSRQPAAASGGAPSQAVVSDATKSKPDKPAGSSAAASTNAPPPSNPPLAMPTLNINKDALALTPEEERRVGRAVNEAITQRHKTVPAVRLQQVILDAARPLLAQRARKEIDYHITILDSADLNIFSHLGGHIYVSRGLFDFVAEDSEWRFLLGHEIAHVDRKHGARRVSEMARAATDAGKTAPGLVAAVYRQVAEGYSDDQEYEADAWAYRHMSALGDSRREGLMFLRRLMGYMEQHRLESHRAPQTAPDADVQDVENHWLTLPSALDRLERLRNLAPGP